MWRQREKYEQREKESAVKVSVWSLWRIVGSGFAFSCKWVSGALYFLSLTAIWISEPVVPGKETPTLTSCWRSRPQGHRGNPISYDARRQACTLCTCTHSLGTHGAHTLHVLVSRGAHQCVVVYCVLFPLHLFLSYSLLHHNKNPILSHGKQLQDNFKRMIFQLLSRSSVFTQTQKLFPSYWTMHGLICQAGTSCNVMRAANVLIRRFHYNCKG